MDILKPRTETYQLTDGTGRLRLRATDPGFAYGFFADNEPILFQYDAQRGTALDIYWHFATLEWEAENAPLRILVAQEPDRQRPLAEQIRPLLQQFPNGVYEFCYGRLPEDTEYLTWATTAEISGEFYSSLDTRYLIPTQPETSIDSARVDEYKQAIENGGSPWAITLSVGWNSELVLDGHHKLTAYNEMMIPAPRLVISMPVLQDLTLEDCPTELHGILARFWQEHLRLQEQQKEKKNVDPVLIRQMARWQNTRS